MKSKFFQNGISRILLLSYLIIMLSSCSIVQAVKYKTMILTVNSKSYLNSREKMNKILEKYKNEISN